MHTFEDSLINQADGRLAHRASLEREKTTDIRHELIAFCQPLAAYLREQGLRMIISGKIAQYLSVPPTEAVSQQLQINDLDCLLLSENEDLLDVAQVIELLQTYQKIGNITLLSSFEVTKNAINHGAVPIAFKPDSRTIKGFVEIGAEQVEIEFFLGNERGAGYQMRGFDLDEQHFPFDPHLYGATQVLEGQEAGIEIVSRGALLSYYLTINKGRRIRELLEANKKNVSALFVECSEINPTLSQKLYLAQQYFMLNPAIEKVAEILGHTEIYIELVLGIAQCIKNIGNLNAGKVFEQLQFSSQETGAKLRFLENNPLVQAAFDTILQVFPSHIDDLSPVLETNDTYKVAQEQLITELLKFMEVEEVVVRQILQNIKKRESYEHDDARYHFFLRQMLENLQRSKGEILGFHGWHHAINTGLVAAALCTKEKMVPKEEQQELDVATMIVGLFHDIGIGLTRSYANHELISSYALAVFIERIRNDQLLRPLVTQSLLKKLEMGVVALYGTAVVVKPDVGLQIGAALTAQEFQDNVGVLAAADKQQFVPTALQQEVSWQAYQQVLANVLHAADADRDMVDRWRTIFSLADVSNMLDPACILGTFELCQEARTLKENQPEPKNTLEASQAAIDIIKGGSALLESLTGYLLQSNNPNFQLLYNRHQGWRNKAIFAVLRRRAETLFTQCMERSGDTEKTLFTQVKCYTETYKFLNQLLLYYCKLNPHPSEEAST